MASLKALKIRIGSVKSTQKITKAMKMVAAAKLRRAQDAAVAVSFLLTELIELAGSVNPQAPIGISVRQAADSDTALLRAVSPALVESDALEMLVKQRYGRIILGLSRQLRAPLHHDPLTGAYEITIAAKPG